MEERPGGGGAPKPANAPWTLRSQGGRSLTRPLTGDQVPGRVLEHRNRRRRDEPRTVAIGRQNSLRVSRSVGYLYWVRTRPRRCNAGTSPSVTSRTILRLTDWLFVVMRNPSPPTSSMISPMRSATLSGVPINSIEDANSDESCTSSRSVFPLPHCWNLSSEPCSPLVVRCGYG